MKKLSLFSWGYISVIILLFLYSYTQVDLDLTFSRLGILHVIIKGFQYIGWFQRPWSTYIFIILMTILFTFYGIYLKKANRKLLSRAEVWVVIFITTIILIFSYNAFSYDLFNYIFDARIFTHYHANPYLHKALDYPHDPMLTFMHWTHRTYPYGPFWLVLTVPLSFIGLGLFIPTFLVFKVLMAAGFLGTAYMVEEISQKIQKKTALFSLVFFALNPLVLIESLVSAHNDIVMMFFGILSIGLFIDRSYIKSITSLVFSVAIKFGTVFFIPMYVVINTLRIGKRPISWKAFFLLTILCMIISVVLVSYRTIYEPWYLLWLLPLGSVISDAYYIVIPGITLSVFSMLYYVPFLYTGTWDQPVQSIIIWLMIIGIILSVILTGMVGIRNRIRGREQK